MAINAAFKTVTGWASVLIVLMSACTKTNDPGPANAAFGFLNANYGENKGAIDIPITLSAAQSQDVSIDYAWSSTDTTTFLGGDFKLITPSPIVIPAGQTTANLQLEIVDDTQLDGEDNVTLTLSTSAPNVTFNSVTPNNTFTLTINDNDNPQANTLQVDLTWYLTDDRTADINGADLALALQDSVIVDPSTQSITNAGITYTSSQNNGGFETIFLTSADPDSVYWIATPYITGTRNVTLVLTLTGLGWTPGPGTGNPAEASYKSSDSGSAIFFGPFTKTGSTFNFSGRNSGNGGDKPRIKQYVASRFE